MTVKELIEALQKKDSNLVVKIAVTTYTQAYPVAYCEPRTFDSESWGELRIGAALPKEMHTVKKKV
jgi:hypothetical protein